MSSMRRNVSGSLRAAYLARAMIVLLAAIFLWRDVTSVRADETDIVLKEAHGRDAVINNCGACHSLDYIQMNAPFLDKAGWEGEVAKMIKSYGAPIDDADAKEIAAYLSANYGK